MGEGRLGPGAEIGVRTLTELPLAVRPAAERLYGRTRGSKLRPRQQWLLDHVLPRLAFDPAKADQPLAAFPILPARLWLEIGFGGGEHARAQALDNPGTGLIACEVYENGICSLLSALAPDEDDPAPPIPANLLVWDDDARLLLRQLPDGCLDRVFLLFPDPWPKSRHAKRRFVHPDNLALVARVLRPGGEWRIASDDPTYQAWTRDVLAAQSLFTVAPPATVRPHGWPATRYERKAELAGRPALFWSAIRI